MNFIYEDLAKASKKTPMEKAFFLKEYLRNSTPEEAKNIRKKLRENPELRKTFYQEVEYLNILWVALVSDLEQVIEEVEAKMALVLDLSLVEDLRQYYYQQFSSPVSLEKFSIAQKIKKSVLKKKVKRFQIIVERCGDKARLESLVPQTATAVSIVRKI